MTFSALGASDVPQLFEESECETGSTGQEESQEGLAYVCIRSV